MKHPVVNRTSPMGKPFVGTCAACGKQGITSKDFFADECENPRNLSAEQALLEAITSNEKKGLN